MFSFGMKSDIVTIMEIGKIFLLKKDLNLLSGVTKFY